MAVADYEHTRLTVSHTQDRVFHCDIAISQLPPAKQNARAAVCPLRVLAAVVDAPAEATPPLL